MALKFVCCFLGFIYLFIYLLLLLILEKTYLAFLLKNRDSTLTIFYL
jgi:hypothetical protein